MSVKKKLGLGLASAALGLSLVGGGTFAYFNDTATIHNQFAAGTLDLDLGSYPNTNWPINFDLKDIRPGQSWERTFVLNNTGSLNIQDVFMAVQAEVQNKVGSGQGTADQFLDTLVVRYFVDVTPPLVDPNAPDKGYLLLNSQDITLKEAIAGDFTGKIKNEYIDGNKLNLTPLGIETGKSKRFRIQIEFRENNQDQNHLQGMSAKVDFKLDARQEAPGQTGGASGPNNGDLPKQSTDEGVND